MFKRISHMADVIVEDEILFSTPFGYMFLEAARSKPCRLPESLTTVQGLKELGAEMGDPGQAAAPRAELDSKIPALFTYFGQFIDHDLTARTDRDSSATTIGRAEPIDPLGPDEVVERLRNGRRPQLDLDSVFGDGPALAGRLSAPPPGEEDAPPSLSEGLYEDFLLRTNQGAGLDVPRAPDGTASIADGRNDENLIISQIQAMFLQFHNAVSGQLALPSAELGHIRSRQLVRWVYQYVVVNQYLPAVCYPGVVLDTLLNGPRFIGSTAGRGNGFMPLEFSTAAFRFGHSMIRPFYTLNGHKADQPITTLLRHGKELTRDPAGKKEAFLPAEFHLAWGNFLGSGATNKARMIDPWIAQGLFDLPAEGRNRDPILRHLAISNLVRGYNLSLPTGQAACDAFGIRFLTPREILDGLPNAMPEIVEKYFFDQRTPLWFYILREAEVQQNGERLGELGSRILCETIIGLIKQDPNAYLNNPADPALAEALSMPDVPSFPGEPPKRGVRIVPNEPGAAAGQMIGSLEDMLKLINIDPTAK